MSNKAFEKPPSTSTRIMGTCETCGKVFWEKASSFLKYKYHFCSKSCRGKQMEKYKTEEERKRARYLQVKAWQKRNIEKVREWKKESNKRCRAVVAHGKARYKARKKGAEGSHTLKEWNEIIQLSGGKCVMCGKVKRLTRDHIIPLSMGGSDYITNIQPLCAHCNSKKGTKI